MTDTNTDLSTDSSTDSGAGATGAVQDAAVSASGAATTGTPPNVADVEEALRDVVDPELGINVVDLGLIYGITVDAQSHAVIDMTLTSAACPLTDVIEDQTAQALDGLRAHPPDQLGVDAAVGPGQDHRRRARAAAGPRLQRLTRPAPPYGEATTPAAGAGSRGSRHRLQVSFGRLFDGERLGTKTGATSGARRSQDLPHAGAVTLFPLPPGPGG